MIKFFCNKCKKEIWKLMKDDYKKSTSIYEAEQRCFCSDCILERNRELDNMIKLKIDDYKYHDQTDEDLYLSFFYIDLDLNSFRPFRYKYINKFKYMWE